MGESSSFPARPGTCICRLDGGGGLSVFLPRETSSFSRGKNWEDLPDSGSPCFQDCEF